VFVGGKRLYGKVEQVGGVYLATTFAFFQFLPLWPLRSYIVVSEGRSGRTDVSQLELNMTMAAARVAARGTAGTYDVIPIKLHWKSVLAGYLRAWGVCATLFTFVPAMVAAGTSEMSAAIIGGVVLIVVAGLTTAAFSWIGRVSATEKAKRLVYARFVLDAVEPSVLDEDVRGKIAQKLRGYLDERATTAMSANGYREKNAPLNAGYRVLALEPLMRDRDYLEASLTLACIEASLSVGGTRAEAEQIHAAIWKKLVAEHPDVVGIVKEAEGVQGSFVRRSLGYVPLLAAFGVVGLMLARNHHVVPPSHVKAEKPQEFGFVPEELLR